MRNLNDVVQSIKNVDNPDNIFAGASQELRNEIEAVHNLYQFRVRMEAMTNQYFRRQATLLGKQF